VTADEIAEALAPTGMAEADMIATIAHLMRADELGIHDQGVSRVPWLAKKRWEGGIFGAPIRCERIPFTANTWRVTGRRIGYALMNAAVHYPFFDDARNVAPQLVIVDNCFPSGALGVWGRMLADRGTASLMTATSQRRVPHPGGGGPFIGTTPLCVTIPDTQEHLVTDLALTEVTYGDVLAGEASADRLRFPNMKLWALGIALETMVRTMSFSESAVLMFLFRPIRAEAVADERRRSTNRLPGGRGGGQASH
jgi:LDH2 family malate/lactate/ureidoglycolate dehydrogenase